MVAAVPRGYLTEGGVRKGEGRVATTTLGTDYTLFTLSTTAKARLIKVHIYNNSGSNANYTLGYTTAAAVWTPVSAPYSVPNGGDRTLTEDEIPAFYYETVLGAAIIIRTDVTNAGAGTQFAEAEVEER